jgi:hypothetical protein
MNRYLAFSLATSVILSTLAIPLRAANKPRAGMEGRKRVWTNDDFEGLQALGLISIVGQPAHKEDATTAALHLPYVETQDPEWYAEQAVKLRDELERRQAQLRKYRQALDDARSLREMTGGIDLDKRNVGITPDAGLEILQQQVNQTQMELQALEDLARRNDIPSGALRGQ